MRPPSSFLRDSSVFLRAYLDRDEEISRVVSSYLLARFFSPRFRRLSRFLRTFVSYARTGRRPSGSRGGRVVQKADQSLPRASSRVLTGIALERLGFRRTESF